MSDGGPLDGRREKALRAELLRRAVALLGGDGQERPPGEIANAMLGVAARIEEEVTRRLDRVPEKQTDNFFTAMGIGRDPARPARLPVAFTLAEPPPDERVAPASTRLMASGEAGPVVFETGGAIALVPGSIAALIGVDSEADGIFQPPGGIVGAALPRAPAAERTLRSGAAAGEDKLQISLATDLAEGTILAIGGAGAPEHRIVAVEGDLVTVDPPLEATAGQGTRVAVVADFAPFAGHRDRQSHAFYLGHETLLNVPSRLSMTVTGVSLLPEATEWSWWGQVGEDPPAWHRLDPTRAGGRLTLAKQAGKPVKKAIGGRETLWLRALLPGRSDGAVEARDIGLSVAGECICREDRTGRCGDDAMEVAFEAIANTTPVVPNSAFHPFGREPRLFDSFYIGCAEAFSKPGAEVSLCFRFAGPELGPLAAVSSDGVAQIFGVGKDGLLYRAQLGRDQPRLVSIVPSLEETGGVALEPRAPVAARVSGKHVFVAIGGKGAVHLAQVPLEGPIEAGALKWSRLVSEEDRGAPIVEVALVPGGDGLVLHAQAEKSDPLKLDESKQDVLLSWSRADTAPRAARQADRRLVPLQGTETVLIVGGGKAAVADKLFDLAGPALSWDKLAAWSAKGAEPSAHGIVLAGYEGDVLKAVRLSGEPIEVGRGPGEVLPIAFEPPPPRAARPGAAVDRPAEDPPTLLLAASVPERFVWTGRAYLRSADSAPIGSAEGRRFVAAAGWIAVQRAEPGLLYRKATSDGRWAEEHVVTVKADPLAFAGNVPFQSEFASPDLGRNGFGFRLGLSPRPGMRLLAKLTGSAGEAILPGTASFYHRSAALEGALERSGGFLTLIDDEAKRQSAAAEEAVASAGEALDEARETADSARATHAERESDVVAARTEVEQAAGRVGQLTTELGEARRDTAAARTTLETRTGEVETARQLIAALERALPPLPTPTPTPTPPPADDDDTGGDDPRADGDTDADDPPAPAPDPGREAALAAIAEARAKLQTLIDRETLARETLDGLIRTEGEASAALTEAQADLEQARTDQSAAGTALTGAASAVTTANLDLAHAQSLQSAAAARQAALPPIFVTVPGDEAAILLDKAGAPAGLWRLARAGGNNWIAPPGFPAGPEPLRYRLLELDTQLPVTEAVEIEDPDGLKLRIEELAKLGESGRLRSSHDPRVIVSAVEEFDRVAAIAYPGAPKAGDSALLTTAVDQWSSLGPSQPPNPALSWEYWNGQSWWALDGAGLIDRTANLLVDNGVFFIVPADLQETEVGGRNNHWIRARLVGGDFGEAQVTVKSIQVGNETHQIVERDMTTIRAPYITALKLGFCALTEVAPEVVLTEDSLKFVDQTSANVAGLPVSIFAPVAETMAGGPPGSPFSRGLMIGFESPVVGDPVSLYVDSVPGGAPAELIAESLRDGRFEAVDVRDETRGLGEPGLIQLSLNAAPDRTDLFGTVAHWIRLRPAGDASSWSPRIRAIHLNAARALSVETREMESLGHSAGIPRQAFRLAEAPVAPGSLELRVREPLGEEERLAPGIDAPPAIGAMPGPWVRWTEVDDLGDPAAPARAFLLDAELGLVQFGDGRRGAIPPLGAELLAVAYRHVAGAAGNAVAPGAKLQLLSTLAGIEQVVALDSAAGGSDIETAEAARRRGAAKLRHGDRILTLADLEDYARSWSPEIAQVRAANRNGAVRLVVAGSGPEPRPAPAMLRELERSVRANSGFLVARQDGLEVAAPRLLPLRVELELEPDDPDRFIEMADSVETALIALFDPAAGGLDGQGWPIGRLPAPGDVHAALEPVSSIGFVCSVALLRSDRRPAAPLPASIPADVLVRLDLDDIVARRRPRAVA